MGVMRCVMASVAWPSIMDHHIRLQQVCDDGGRSGGFVMTITPSSFVITIFESLA